MPGGELKGRWALVTGASSGLGVDFARELARRGCHLILVARREERLREVADELSEAHGIDTEVIALDLGTPGAPDTLHREIASRGRTVEVLINNAGFGVFGDYLDIPWEREATMIDLDIRTLAHLTKLYSREMVERGFGRILEVSSVGAFQATPTYAAYSAAKAFVLLFSEAVHFELRGTGVTCTAIAPGVTATEFLEVSGQKPTFYQRMLRMTSARVAAIGIRAMEAGRSKVVPGLINKILAFSIRLMPRGMATRTAWMTMKNE